MEKDRALIAPPLALVDHGSGNGNQGGSPGSLELLLVSFARDDQIRQWLKRYLTPEMIVEDVAAWLREQQEK
jgi:hypothetical protein